MRLTRGHMTAYNGQMARLTNENVAFLRREVAAGRSIMDVIKSEARFHGVGYTTARQAATGETWGHVQEPPVDTRDAPERDGRRKLTPEQVVRAHELFNAGKSKQSIAVELGVGYTTIRGVLPAKHRKRT